MRIMTQGVFVSLYRRNSDILMPPKVISID